jgi:hypothetical protein
MSVGSSARTRVLLGCAAVPAVAALGAWAAICIPAARADVLPTLPTASLPIPTVTLPLGTVPSVPVVTTGPATTGTSPAETTAASTSDTGSGDKPTTTAKPAGDVSGVAGAIRLASGAVSIPIESVTAPARLAIDRITVSPKWIGARGQRVSIVVRIADSRGYRVRGASVEVRSMPGRMLKPAAARTTRTDGTVILQPATTLAIPVRAGATLVLVVRAYRAGSPSSSIVARRVVSLPIRLR